MAVQIQFKRGSMEAWKRHENIILASGELGFEKLEYKDGKWVGGDFKIGDGITKWADLPYYKREQSEYIVLVSELPDSGEPNKLYRKEQEVYYWDTDAGEWVGLNTKLSYRIESLEKQFEENLDTINNIDDTLKNFNDKLEEDISTINDTIDTFTNDTLPNFKSDITDTILPSFKSEITDTILPDFKNDINQTVLSLNDKVDVFDKKINEETLPEIQATLIEVQQISSDIEKTIEETETKIEQFDIKATEIQENINTINSKIDNFEAEQAEKIKTEIQNTTADIEESINQLSEKYDTISGEIDTLKEDVEELKIKPDKTINNIVLVDTFNSLPENGRDNVLYKTLDTQLFYYWDTKEFIYQNLASSVISEGGGIDNIEIVEELPAIGEENKLYRRSGETIFSYWDGIDNKFIELKTSSSVGGGIYVVDKFEDLPEEGEADTLYKVLSDQLLYNYNTLTKAYQPLGQSGGNLEEGYNITLQSTIDRIFATIKGEPVILKFRYSSVDNTGFADGAGIGTLYVNDVKKTTVAIPQKVQELDITQYLTLGENNVELKVENSEGADKAKSLAYNIELVDLYLTTNVKSMDIYDSETALPFQITGSGTKTLYYYMDDELLASEEITSTNVYSHTYRVPMQVAGDHILKIHAERVVNNMTISSNTLTFGMMFITDEMVDTFILSSFEQKESAQGEIITIPYMVYNPFLETSNVILTIYNEDGSIYGTPKEITVDQTVQHWVTQDYPAGKVTFEIQAHSDSGVNAIKQFEIDIEASTFGLDIIKDGLVLEFSAAGRSNAEANPEHWSYTDEETKEVYEGSFERFAWSGADGWIESDAGETVLRLLPKNKFTIPFYPFRTDKRSTGYTIEIELETRDVANQDSIIMSCMSGNRGFEIYAQQVIFKSALSEVQMYFKEDERVRITIVVEASTLDRVIYMFINGIICAAVVYEENDSFQQVNPVPVSIGSDTCGIDLYKLRFYNRSFTFTEQLNNFMCDRSTNAERFKIKERNDIYDISGNITIGSLPPEIPYLVMQCEELPQYKGDKKKKKSMYFVDQLNPDRCFSATGVQFDVQGTSSAGYPIKNFKVKFGDDGIVYNDGRVAEGYPIVNPDDLISKCLCLKADYASSEQANNVMLVDFYDEVIRDYFLTPPQEENPKVRTGISGRPIVVFWENTETGEIKFQGQYNMNNDKSNENVFGFDRDIYPQLECWEFSNNTSDRCLFKKSEYEEEIYDEEKKKWSPAWMADFEARFPDLDDKYRDYTNYKRLTDWVVSTRQDQATNEDLPELITYGDDTYTKDTAEYRLAKFKYEFEDYFIKDPIIFYYIFTEVFLMIDNRAKNMFLTSFDGQHWFPIPYDFDTAIGINNEGKLVFDYDLEDYEFIGGKPVYNGQESTLWINVRDAFTAEIFDMYDKLRTSNKFSYEIINKKMNEHQEKCWPESIWNEDAKLKYVDVFLKTGTNYLEMCQGNKKTQREWWLYNTFKYRDSKYRTGDAQKIIATFRAYAPDDFTITPYQHLWPRVDYTDSYPVTKRAKKNIPTLLECPLDTANDTEMFIRSADRIANFGDLSKYMADTVNFAAAEKLQNITLGSHEDGYINTKLSSLTVGTNRLLTYLNVENCVALNKTIDLSNCLNLETIDAFGSALPSVTLPVGGHLKHLNLPASITSFEIKNQHMIESFQMESYENLETLVIDDTPGLPIETLLTETPNLSCVRIVNTTWKVSSETVLKQIFDKLKTCIGKDVNGNNVANAVITGYVEIDAISDEFLEELNDTFTELIVIVNGKTRFFLRYVNWNNELLYKYAVSQGDNAIDPVNNQLIDIPTRDGGEDTIYKFARWSDLPTNVQLPQNMVAIYDIQYRVQFFDGNNNIVNTQWITKSENAVDPIVEGLIVGLPSKSSDAQFNYVYAQWDKEFTNITSPLDVYAEFSSFLRDYEVRYYNGDILLDTRREYYGTTSVYGKDESVIKKIIGGEESPYYEFAYWSLANGESGNPIIGDTDFYAQFVFDGYIEDDWNTIATNVAIGKTDTYGYGGKKTIEFSYSYNGTQYDEIIDLEIVDKNHEDLEFETPGYNNNTNKAGLTFRGVLKLVRNLNNGPKDWNGNTDLSDGGWTKCDARKWLNNEFFNSLPVDLSSNIKSVKKISDNGYHDKGQSLATTYDKIFLPSAEELGLSGYKWIVSGQGPAYVLFTDTNSRKIGKPYWTRSSAKGEIHSWIIVDSSGYIFNTGGGNSSTIMFFFCI